MYAGWTSEADLCLAGGHMKVIGDGLLRRSLGSSSLLSPDGEEGPESGRERHAAACSEDPVHPCPRRSRPPSGQRLPDAHASRAWHPLERQVTVRAPASPQSTRASGNAAGWHCRRELTRDLVPSTSSHLGRTTRRDPWAPSSDLMPRPRTLAGGEADLSDGAGRAGQSSLGTLGSVHLGL